MNESKLFCHLQRIDDLVDISDTELKDIRQSIQLSDKRLERIAETEYKQLELLNKISNSLSYVIALVWLVTVMIVAATWEYLQ